MNQPRRITPPASTLVDRFLLCSKLTPKEERTLIALCKYGKLARASKAMNLNLKTITTQARAVRLRLQVDCLLHACLIYQQYRLQAGCSLALVPSNPIFDTEATDE